MPGDRDHPQRGAADRDGVPVRQAAVDRHPGLLRHGVRVRGPDQDLGAWLDEVGRGTATDDGLAIARAVLEDINRRIGARALFATHYLELTAVAEKLPGVTNVHVAALERDGRVVFLYAVRPGPADRAYGIQVARLAGLPIAVVERARAVVEALEAAEQLEREDGLSVEVLDLRSLLPMDDEAIVATVRPARQSRESARQTSSPSAWNKPSAPRPTKLKACVTIG